MMLENWTALAALLIASGAAVISQTAEYALRAISFLAERSPNPATTKEIARGTRVPPAYLSKVLQALGRAGIVQTQRGVGGGVSLCRPLDELTMLEVVNAVDPILRIKKCPLGLAAHGVRLCPMHSRLDAAMAAIETALRASTLAEVLSEPPSEEPRCKFPRSRSK